MISIDTLVKLEVVTKESHQFKKLSLFTCEEYYTHVIQNKNLGIRNVGSGIGAVGKDYTHREKGYNKNVTARRKIFFYNFWINEG